MTILTNLPVTLTCGTPATVTLDPAQLITDFGIVDPYWSDSANWRQCKFVYGSDQTTQKTKINFTITSGILSLATNAYNGGWECSGIFITDGLENQLVFKRSEFPTASEFDFASTGGYSPIPAALWSNFGTANIASTGLGELHRAGGGSDWINSAWINTPIQGDFTFSGVYDESVNCDVMIGYKFAMPQADTGISNTIDTGLYFHTSVTMANYAGANAPHQGIADNTPPVLASNTWEIKRVGNYITGKVNGILVFHETTYDTLYVSALMFQPTGCSIVSANLSISAVSAPVYTRDFGIPNSVLAGETLTGISIIPPNILALGAATFYVAYDNTSVFSPTIGRIYKIELTVDTVTGTGASNQFFNFQFGITGGAAQPRPLDKVAGSVQQLISSSMPAATLTTDYLNISNGGSPLSSDFWNVSKIDIYDVTP